MKKKNGRNLCISQFIIFILFGIVFIALGFFLNDEYNDVVMFKYFGIYYIILGLCYFIYYFKGKETAYKYISIIITSLLFTGYFGLFGVIGAAIDYKNFKENKDKEKDAVIQESGNTSNENNLKYNHDSKMLQMLLDKNNTEDIPVRSQNGDLINMKQVFTCPINGKLYCILKPLEEIEGVNENEAIVFSLEEDEEIGEHILKVVLDEELAAKVFDYYNEHWDALENIESSDTVCTADKIEVNDVDENITKRNYISSTIAICILYLALIVVGILGVTNVLCNPLNKVAYNGESLEAGKALSMSLGIIFFSFIPTIGYFFAFNRMYNIKNKFRVLIFIISLILSLGMVALFLILYNSLGYSETINTFDNSSWEQILTICVSHVGLLLIYLLTFLKIDYEKLDRALSKVQKSASDEPSNSQFLTVIVAYLKQFMKLIARVFILLLKAILLLRDKNKTLYYTLFTVFFTLLCYFTSFISIIVFIGVIIGLVSLLALGSLKFMIVPTTHYVYRVIEDGSERELVYDSYYNGHERYKDDIGNYWYTDDNGTTFYKE